MRVLVVGDKNNFSASTGYLSCACNNVNMDKMTPLKQMLNGRGIKSKWLAQQIHIEESSMSAIVNGKRKPTLDTAIRIARVMGSSVEELFGWMVDN